MNRTSRSSSEVRTAARSPARSTAGPDVYRTFTPSSRAMIVASVVLPRPGGPYRRMWSAASPLPFAACRSTERLALTSRWPMYSSSVRGRRVPSTTRSPSSPGSADRMRERSSAIGRSLAQHTDVSHACSTRTDRASAKYHYATRASGVGCCDAPVPPLRIRPPRADRPRPPQRRRADRARHARRTQPPPGQVPRADHGHAQARRASSARRSAPTAATRSRPTRRRSRWAGSSGCWTAPWRRSPASRCATTSRAPARTRRPARCATRCSTSATRCSRSSTTRRWPTWPPAPAVPRSTPPASHADALAGLRP